MYTEFQVALLIYSVCSYLCVCVHAPLAQPIIYNVTMRLCVIACITIVIHI